VLKAVKYISDAANVSGLWGICFPLEQRRLSIFQCHGEVDCCTMMVKRATVASRAMVHDNEFHSHFVLHVSFNCKTHDEQI